ncbi:MAG: AfsR/SARP family transcriptional regulator, partial [Anaerolineales bacterium]
MGRLALSLLGGFEARIDLGPPLLVPTKKAQALLAYLALPPGRTHPRDKLAALLWGDTPSGPARNALRQTLFILRKALGGAEPATLHVTGDAIALAPAVVQTDVEAFERAVAEGTPSSLGQTVDLYRGDLLAGLTVVEPAFEDWLMAERERLRELALEALARLLAHQRAVGATADAVQSALRLLALDPLQEAVHRTLMRLYAQLGRRDAALRQYQECVEVLQRELGVEPEPETKTLYQEILRQRPARPRATPMAAPG